MRAHQQPLLNQIGFIHFLERIRLLTQRSPQIIQTNGTPVELINQRFQQSPIHFIQSLCIHPQQRQRLNRNFFCNHPIGARLCIIARPRQLTPGNARCSPRPVGNHTRGILFNLNTQNTRSPHHNGLQLFGGVKIQPLQQPKARSHRRCEQSQSRCCAHHSKGFKRNLIRPGTRPAIDHNIQRKILHCRIQMFFYHPIHAMNLVDKQHIALIQIRQNPRQISRALQYRSRCHMNFNPQLVRYHISHRRFAQTGRPVQQNVIHSLIAMMRSLYSNTQIRLRLFLPDHIVKSNRTNPLIVFKFVAILKLGIGKSFIHKIAL